MLGDFFCETIFKKDTGFTGLTGGFCGMPVLK